MALVTTGLRSIECALDDNDEGEDVSDQMRISRRRVMQMGVLAPLVALKASGASAETISSAAQKLARIPDGTMKKLKHKATTHCNEHANHCPGYKEKDFGDVVSCLWTYFSAGVSHAGAATPEDDLKIENLMTKAYETTNPGTGNEESGTLIASRIGDWANTWEHVTNYCAFRTGLHAAEVVGTGGIVDETAYRIAFERTQSEMRFIMDKVRYKNGNAASQNRGGGC